MKYFLKTSLVLFSFIFLSIFISPSYASQTSPVNATVKIGVCGNDVAEGTEGCDNEDFRGKTCTSYGFASGTLTCDIACGINTSLCLSPTPTVAASTNTNTTTSTDDKNSNQPAATAVPTESQGVNTPLIIESGPKSFLPEPIVNFLTYNGFDKITVSDIPLVVGGWVEAWQTFVKDTGSPIQQKCDVNGDNVCDVKDFSVLMSYVEK